MQRTYSSTNSPARAHLTNTHRHIHPNPHANTPTPTRPRRRHIQEFGEIHPETRAGREDREEASAPTSVPAARGDKHSEKVSRAPRLARKRGASPDPADTRVNAADEVEDDDSDSNEEDAYVAPSASVKIRLYFS